MSIRYKLIVSMIAAILMVVLPLSLFFLREQEKKVVASAVHEGRIFSRILALSAKTVLLMNAGDIEASSIDCREIMSMLEPNFEKGLVYADAVLLSSSARFRGRILASIGSAGSVFKQSADNGRLSEEKMKLLLATLNERQNPGTTEHIPGHIEMVSTAELSEGVPFIMGRMVYSRRELLEPVRELRIAVLGILVMVLTGVGIIGLVFGVRLAQPIERLIARVERIESGDLSHEVVPLANDEMGRLASSFNRMAKALDMKMAEIEAVNAELSRLDALKDEFLANTSHELKTPLNGIVGIAESLREGAAGALNETALHNLSMIAVSGRRLLRLVNDILDIARIRNGEIKLDLRSVDVGAITRVVIALFEPLARRKGIELRSAIEPGRFLARADEDRLQQILFNLVDNAVKFTDQGGVEISALFAGDGRTLSVEVKDTGIGIDEADREVIFDYFAQADGSASRRHGGTGLGLAIARNLVELHGGFIVLRSEKGKGATFSLELPVAAVDEPPQQSSASLSLQPPDAGGAADLVPVPRDGSAGGREGVILVVDDETVNLQVMVNYLGLAGYTLWCARGGADALRVIDGGGAGGLPDLVLLDIMMPGLNGFDVLERIRARYSPHELPVIVLTARRNPGDVAAAFAAGANDYIAKPFDREELLSRVGGFVGLKRSVARQKELSVLQRELEMARQIQSSIIPSFVPRIPGVEIALRYLPANSVGGDLYDFHHIDERRFGVMIADVSGHGMAASVVGAMFKMAFSLHRQFAARPGELIAGMNQTLYPYMPRHFVTAAYLLVDLEAMRVYSSNAGHFPVPFLKRKTGALEFIYTPGRAMGITPGQVYGEAETAIAPGDRLLLYTDGITECRDRHGELFGERRLFDLIYRTTELSPERCVHEICHEAARWVDGDSPDEFEDDVCLICVDIG